MDSMVHKLEKYADNLENIVQHRTAELIDEKQKTDMLLHRMLPPYIRFHYYSSLFLLICKNFYVLCDIITESQPNRSGGIISNVLPIICLV